MSGHRVCRHRKLLLALIAAALIVARSARFADRTLRR